MEDCLMNVISPKTQVIDQLTIYMALREIEHELGSKPEKWSSRNEQQAKLLSLYWRYGDQVKDLSFLEAKVSRDANFLNAYLREKGYRIQLRPFQPGGFGVVALLDLLLNWSFPGTETSVRANNTTYPAFKLELGVTINDILGYQYPVASVSTDTGERVFMTVAEEPLEGLALAQRIMELSALRTKTNWDFSGVIAPEVSIDQRPNVSQLVGMYTFDGNSQQWYIDQILQQVKFGMNRIGARVRAATGMAVEKSISLHKAVPLEIDKPFYLWIMGRSSLPLATMYIAPDSWKKVDLKTV
jgi:hypothetical protein